MLHVNSRCWIYTFNFYIIIRTIIIAIVIYYLYDNFTTYAFTLLLPTSPWSPITIERNEIVPVGIFASPPTTIVHSLEWNFTNFNINNSDHALSSLQKQDLRMHHVFCGKTSTPTKQQPCIQATPQQIFR